MPVTLGSIGFFESIQEGVNVIYEDGRREYIDGSTVKEVLFKYNGRPYRFISYAKSMYPGNSPKSGFFFIRLIKDGPAQLYKWYEYEHFVGDGFVGGGYEQEIYAVKREHKDLVFLKGRPFKISMAYYFTDCPELQEKILAGEFNKRKVYQMILYYNNHCAND